MKEMTEAIYEMPLQIQLAYTGKVFFHLMDLDLCTVILAYLSSISDLEKIHDFWGEEVFKEFWIHGVSETG